jgi:imidazolonepropionase-like amidohydrolase
MVYEITSGKIRANRVVKGRGYPLFVSDCSRHDGEVASRMVGPMVSIYSAARVVLREIDRLASDRANFSFGTTLSGLTYLRRMESWKQVGYRIEIVYLRLDSVDLEAIRISTLNGAMYEGRQASIGSIEAGKNADLVVIKGKPVAGYQRN